MPERRIGIVSVATALLFAVVAGGLVRLQVCESARHKARAEQQRQSTQTVRPFRGAILDRNGVVLARDETRYDIDIRPALAEESDGGIDVVLARVAKIASLDLEHLRERFGEIEAKARKLFEREIERLRRRGDLAEAGSRKRKRQEKVARRAYRSLAYPLVRDVVPKVRDQAHEAGLPGIAITPRPLRNYPQGTLAAHLLGHVGQLRLDEEYRRRGIEEAYRARLTPNLGARRVDQLLRRNTFRVEPYGKAGIEKQYDRLLRGSYGVNVRRATATGKEPVREIAPRRGTDLSLTLDTELQKLAETLLDGRPGAVVAMDPRNGEVLVLASSPTFDPAASTRAVGAALVNRAIAGLYPPGSTIKAADAVAALEEIEEFANRTYTCTGSYAIGRRTMRCMHTHGAVSLLEAIKRSCNIFFYQTGLALGKRRNSKLVAWFRRFEVDVPTGIDLPGEKGGTLEDPRYGGEVANLAIGQGAFTTTPLRMATLFSAIANGGSLVTPHLRLDMDSGDYPRRQLPIRPETLRTVKKGLRMVVNESGGTANRAFRGASYRAAGKTGSAQPGGNVTTHAWFIGYAPADDPTLCIAVIVENAGGGGSKAAPIARSLFDKYFGPQP